VLWQFIGNIFDFDVNEYLIINTFNIDVDKYFIPGNFNSALVTRLEKKEDAWSKFTRAWTVWR
jgi:hypothetical protein